MPIDPALLMLSVARALPLAWLAPLGGRDLPRVVSLAILLALASALCAFSPPLTVALNGDRLIVSLFCELALGGVFALACALPFIALQWTGQLAQTVVLLRGPAETGPLSTLFRLAALNVFFMLGGHRSLSATLIATLDDLPLGMSRLRAEPLALGLAQLSVDALALSLALALPLLLTLWIVDVALGLVARAQGRALMTRESALRAALALVILALTFTPVIDAFPLAMRAALTTARSLLRAIAA